MSWSPPTGDYSSTVSAYRVYWIDASVAGSFLDSLRTTATSITPPNLVPGHRYNLAVASINAAREGLPAGAPATIINGGTPPLPP